MTLEAADGLRVRDLVGDDGGSIGLATTHAKQLDTVQWQMRFPGSRNSMLDAQMRKPLFNDALDMQSTSHQSSGVVLGAPDNSCPTSQSEMTCAHRTHTNELTTFIDITAPLLTLSFSDRDAAGSTSESYQPAHRSCITQHTADSNTRSCCQSPAAHATPSDNSLAGRSSREPLINGYRHEDASPSSATPTESPVPEAHSCDFERFKAEVSPKMPADSSQPLRCTAQRLTLKDLWEWYLQPSLFGREVITLRGGLSESRAFFVPFISAIQLFVTDDEQPPVKHPKGQRNRIQGKRYHCKVPGWQKNLKLLCEHRARQYPWERMPAYNQLQALANGKSSDQLPDPLALLNCPLADLHPCSWFSIAWWPAYRIPDGPLEASFLVFHSLSAIHEQIAEVDVRAPELDLPVAGIMWYKIEEERWLHARCEQSDDGLPSGPESESLPDVDVMFQAYLAELQGSAKRMGLGLDVEFMDANGQLQEAPQHGDFQWFVSKRR